MADHENFSTLAYFWQLVDSGHWAQLGYGEMAVIMVLLRHANSQGQSWPSIVRIAAESGIHRINVQRAIKRLAVRGLVVKKFIRLSARRSKNLFTLRMPETPLERQTRPEKQKRDARGRFSAKQAALTSNTDGLDSKPSLSSNVDGLVSGAVSDKCSADGHPLTSNVDGQKYVAHTDLEEDIEEKEEKKEKSGGRFPPSQVRSTPLSEERKDASPASDFAVPKKDVSSIVRNLSRSLGTPKKSGMASGEAAFRDLRKKLGLPKDPQDG